MEKIILNRDTYENVKAMLESPDEENMVLAFECIANADIKENLPYIMLLYMEANIPTETWKKESLNRLDKFLKPMTYGEVLNVMKKYESSIESYQLFMDRYALHLKRFLNNKLEKIEVEEIQITIKIKTNESRATSQDLQRLNA